MDLREQLRRHRKDNRLIVGGLAVLLVLLTAIFYLIQRGRDLPSTLVTNRVLLFVLWYVNVVLILTILFVLFRNLFKIWVERRHRILGSKFKTKLVATYIGLSLIPVLLLFAIAAEMIHGSMDRLLQTPVREVVEEGKAVADALYQQVEELTFRGAARALEEVEAFDLKDPENRPELGRLLQRLLAELKLDLLAVYEETDFVHAVVNPQAGITDLPEPGRRLLFQAAREGRATRLYSSPGKEGRLVLAAAARGAAVGRPQAVVVAGTSLDPDLARTLDRLIQAYQGQRQLEVQREDLRASYFLIFLMVTLLILLASSWMGLYLARRVTIPIQALADGTRRISSGDLDHRVEVAADDELGVLVESFNRMTADLKRNKELLEQSNQELMAANERLGEERALLAAVLENVAAGVISLDARGRIFICNGAALHILRQREEEVLGRSAEAAWQDPERRKLLALLQEAPPGDRLTREVHLILGGDWRILEVKATWMRDGSGEIAGQVLVLEDLTELIKAQKLAAWNEAARRIAHEIKNPLTPIRLAAERILKKYRQADPRLGEAIEEGLEIIAREVESMQGMVDEFSRYARMPRPQPSRVDLDRLVEETLHLYRGLKPGVEIEGWVAAGARQAWLDAEQMKRALINLLDNALEATDPPGKVTVSAASENGRVVIQVADTGRGIPHEARDKLFLPYYSTKGRGTGLGLAIVHRIVSDHHGTIRVEDNEPRGTVFTIELPLP